ncbi:type IV toxin-antitoxin system AbiEi family antitoxin [Acidovorax sp.]|uniref:type IV toxin-antitoxin system AbiEi family antitoxin n=1 Tax=Acidovorax sp. TaxID=1872122 RepID=UPI00391C48EA
MNNNATLTQAISALRAETGLLATNVAQRERESAPGGTPPDAWIDIAPPQGHPVRFAAEIKVIDRFTALGALHARARHWAEPPLLVAPFVTAEAARQCRSLGLNFIDAAGNAYLNVPGCFVYVTGRARTVAARPAGRFKSLTPAGLRIVFALLTRPGLVAAPYREIAAAAGVALGSVGDVLADLQARGHLAPREPRRILATAALQEEWATHFPVTLRPQLQARRFTAPAPNWWKGLNLQPLNAAWGGEVAAHHLTGYLEPEQITIYTAAPEPLILKHRLRPDPDGAVKLLDTFWPLAEDAATGSETVHPLLVYADLMATTDPRNIDTAQRIRTQYLDVGNDAPDSP